MMKGESYFVLDCSSAMSLVLPDEQDKHISKLEKTFVDSKAIVPSIWPYEVGNVLSVAEKRNRLDAIAVMEARTALQALPIEIDSTSTLLAFNETLQIARDYKLTVYDAAYLELAIRKALPLCTLDKVLASVAKKVRLKVY